jgi:hypothetical protein
LDGICRVLKDSTSKYMIGYDPRKKAVDGNLCLILLDEDGMLLLTDATLATLTAYLNDRNDRDSIIPAEVVVR